VLSGGYVNTGQYFWQGPAGFSSTSSQVIRPSSTAAYGGIYSLRVQDIHGCSKSKSDTIQVLANPILVSHGDKVCLNDPAILTVSGAVSYSWTGPGFYSSHQASASIVKANSSITEVYTVTGQAANGCTSQATALLDTWPLPIPSIQMQPSSGRLCVNDNLILEGFGGEQYSWAIPGGMVYQGKVLQLTMNSANSQVVYTLTVVDSNACRATSLTLVRVDPLPQGDLAGTQMDACVPFRSDFNLRGSANIKANWQISDGKRFVGSSFSDEFKTAGDYNIWGSFTDTSSGCVNTASFIVHAREIPRANFSYEPLNPIEGGQVFFSDSSQGLQLNKWSWYFVNNQSGVSENKNSFYFFKDPGIFAVAMVVSNTWGCSDTMVKAIKVNPDFNVFVPNAFTPNGDNDNEVFLPVTTGVKFYELRIFNRWGQELFFTNNLNVGWDGTFNGENCQLGVYTWKINVTSLSGENKTLSGGVTLYR
jgi:gliding motility-associated-like protein